MDQIGLLPGLVVDHRVEGEEVPAQPVHQDRPRQALLDQERVVTERGVQLEQPLGQPRACRHPLQLAPEHLVRHGSLPKLLQRHALLENHPNLGLQQGSRHCFIERPGRAKLMGVGDAFDDFLAFHAILEGQATHLGVSAA